MSNNIVNNLIYNKQLEELINDIDLNTEDYQGLIGKIMREFHVSSQTANTKVDSLIATYKASS